jgi:osomolarity two-component system response regulator SSK1
MEWGCMQALIDFDGWRKWKDFSQTKPADPAKAAPGTTNANNKSPKAALNSKAQAPIKKERQMSLALGKENAGSDGMSTDTNGDSGDGGEVGSKG